MKHIEAGNLVHESPHLHPSRLICVCPPIKLTRLLFMSCESVMIRGNLIVKRLFHRTLIYL